MDSALSWRFAARRSAPSMVVPLISAATLSAGRHGMEATLRVSLSAPLVCVVSSRYPTNSPNLSGTARHSGRATGAPENAIFDSLHTTPKAPRGLLADRQGRATGSSCATLTTLG